MQINHHYNAHQLPRPKFGPQQAGTSLAEATGASAERGAGLQAYARLLNEVRDDSEVRSIQVAQAKAKLEQGTLLTRDAAEATAQAIMQEFS